MDEQDSMKQRISELERKVQQLQLFRVEFERLCGPGGFEDVMMRLKKVSPPGAYRMEE